MDQPRSLALKVNDDREAACMRPRGHRLEGNVAKQAVIAELGQAALEGRSLGALLEDAVTAVRAVMALDAVAAMQHEPAQSAFHVRAQLGLPTAARVTRFVPVHDAALSAALSSHAPVSLSPAASHPRGALGAGQMSGLVMPIHDGAAAWGVLALYSLRPRMFTGEEIDFVHAVGNVLSEAMHRMRSLEELRHQALHDPLTGLPNRALFVDRLALALGQHARTDRTVAALFLDLDNFKLVNDSLGHGLGDAVLQHVAQRLAQSLKPGDTVARFGGDEFALICTELNSVDDAEAVAARISDAIRMPCRIAGIEHRLAVSIGIAAADDHTRSPEDLIREADAAMYRAKERGRNRYELFDEQMRSLASHRLWMANEVSQALDRGELRVEYQPIVGLDDGRVRGAEALVRWGHPTRGEISPVEFIPVAEETGAIMQIGEFVLREACHAAADWGAPGRGDSRVPVSVNVSLRQVRHGDLAEVVELVLGETALDPALLHLEITESVLMAETEAAAECMQALRELGISIVLDDFGTGYSSLAYVKRFPIDMIKIDRTFIADLEADDKNATIVEAIIAMTHGLRLKAVAEGVETAAQARWLQATGCELAQGWYFASALSRRQMQAVISASVPAAMAG